MRIRTIVSVSAATVALTVGGITVVAGTTGGSASDTKAGAAATSGLTLTPQPVVTSEPTPATESAAAPEPAAPSASPAKPEQPRLVMGKYDTSEFAAQAADVPAGLDAALAKIDLTPAQFLANGQAASDATTVVKELQADGVKVNNTRMNGTQLIVTVPTAADAKQVESYGATAEISTTPAPAPPATPPTVTAYSSPGAGDTPLEGGDGWAPAGGGMCSVGFTGFDTTPGSTYGTPEFATAGHCLGTATSGSAVNSRINTFSDLAQGGGGSVSIDYGASLGTIDPTRFKNSSGDDYGTVLVKNAAVNAQPVVTTWGGTSTSSVSTGVQNEGYSLPVVGSSGVFAGQSICRSGWRTGWQCGIVYNNGTNLQRTFASASASGSSSFVGSVFATNVYACGGDSGGSAISGNYAVGTVSGGAWYVPPAGINISSGQCISPAESAARSTPALTNSPSTVPNSYYSNYQETDFFPVVSMPGCTGTQCASFQRDVPSFQLGVNLPQPTLTTAAATQISGTVPPPSPETGTKATVTFTGSNQSYSAAVTYTGVGTTTAGQFKITFPTLAVGTYPYTVQASNGLSTSEKLQGTLVVTASSTFSVASTSVSVASAASSQATVAVNSTGNWTATSNQAWLTVPASGTSANSAATFTANANNTATSARTATVTITGPNGGSIAVTVTQAGSAPPATPITLSRTTGSSGFAGGDDGINVTATGNWAATSNQSWLTVSPSVGSGNQAVGITAAANMATSPRKATVTFSNSAGASATYTLTQAGAPAVPSATVAYLNGLVMEGGFVGFAGGSPNPNIIVAANANWTATSNQSWFTVSPASGTPGSSRMSFTAAANPTTSTRTATVTVTAQGGTSTIYTLTQGGGDGSVAVSPTSVSLSAGASNSTPVTVTSAQVWNVKSDVAWLTPGTTSGSTGTVYLSVTANPTAVARIGTLTFSTPGGAATVQVTQASAPGVVPTVTLSSNSNSVGYTGGFPSPLVTATGAWSATSDQSWLTVSPTSGGVGTSAITVTAAMNVTTSARSATVRFTTSAGVSGSTYILSQDGAPPGTVFLASFSGSVGSAGGSTSTTVTTDGTWSASSDQPWLTVTPASGTTGSRQVTFTAQANTASYSRTAWVAFNRQGSNYIYYYALTQAGQAAAVPTLSLSSPTGSVGSAAGSTTSVTVNATGAWSTSSNASSWLTVSPASGGSGSTVVNFNAQANTSTSTRTASVIFTPQGGTSVTYTLTQPGAAPTLSLSAPTGSVGSAAGSTASVTVTANGAWSATSNGAWFTLSPTSGAAGSTVVNLTAQANTTTSPRSATVTFTPQGGTGVTYELYQYGAEPTTFNLSSFTGSVGAAGGSAGTTVTADGAWVTTIDPSYQSWLTVSPASGGSGSTTVTVTATTANTATYSRSGQVYFSSPGGGGTVRAFTLTQSGAAAVPTLSLSAPTGSVGSAAGSTASVTVTANGAWSASSNGSWFALSPASGAAGSTVVNFTAQANTATSSRSATVTFTPQGGTAVTYTLTQNGATPTLNLSAPTGSVGSAAGSTASVTVTANGAWSATSNGSWFTLSPASGGSGSTVVNFNAQANTSTSSRSATVTFTPQGGTAVTYTLTQNGATPTVTLSSQTGTLTSGLSSLGLTATANANWSATSNQSWLTVSPASGSTGSTAVYFTIQANPTTSTRSATVTFTPQGGASTTYPITQPGATPTVTLSNPSGLIGYAASSTNTTVTATGAWSASSDASWLTVTPASGGVGSTVVTFAASENPIMAMRSANVTFTPQGGTGVTYIFSQGGALPNLTFSTSMSSLGSAGGSTSTTVTGTGAWSASSNATWLTLSPASGAAGSPTTVTFSAQANTATSSRSATVTFTLQGGSGSTTYVVTQTGATVVPLVLSQSAVTLAGSVGSTAWVTATSTGAWTATSDQSWLNITPASGSTGDTSVALVANAVNATASNRSATVTFTGPNSSKVTVTVTQTPQPVSVSSTLVSLTSGANSSSVTVTSPNTWTASSSQAWLSVSAATGASGSRSVTLTATANPGTATRTATVTFTAPGGSATVTVTQTGAALVVSSPAVTVAGVAGSMASVTVSATGAWTASSNQSWAFVFPTSGGAGDTNVTVITNDANMTGSNRSATVTFTGPNSTNVTVTLTQTPAPPVSLNTTGVIVTGASTSTSVAVTATGAWTASSDQSWVTLSPASGASGSTVVTLMIAANPATTTRQATLTVKGPNGSSASLTVTQQGR